MVLILGGARLDIGALVKSVPAGKVIETRIPLSCFAAAGADLAAVGAPIRLDADAGFTITLRSARVTDGRGQAACPPRAF